MNNILKRGILFFSFLVALSFHRSAFGNPEKPESEKAKDQDAIRECVDLVSDLPGLLKGPTEGNCDNTPLNSQSSLRILNPSPDLVGNVFSLEELGEITELKPVGGGGEGSVYQVKTVDGKTYAVKIYRGFPAKAGMKFESWYGAQTVEAGVEDQQKKRIRNTYGENLPRLTEQTPATVRLYRVGFARGQDLAGLNFAGDKMEHLKDYLYKVEVMDLAGKAAGGLNEDDMTSKAKANAFSDATPAAIQLLDSYDQKTLHEYGREDYEMYNRVITPSDKIVRFGKRLSDFDYWRLTFLDKNGKEVYRYIPKRKMIEQWIDFAGTRQKADYLWSDEKRKKESRMTEKSELEELANTKDLASPPASGMILDLKTGKVFRGGSSSQDAIKSVKTVESVKTAVSVKGIHPVKAAETLAIEVPAIASDSVNAKPASKTVSATRAGVHEKGDASSSRSTDLARIFFEKVDGLIRADRSDGAEFSKAEENLVQAVRNDTKFGLNRPGMKLKVNDYGAFHSILKFPNEKGEVEPYMQTYDLLLRYFGKGHRETLVKTMDRYLYFDGQSFQKLSLGKENAIVKAEDLPVGRVKEALANHPNGTFWVTQAEDIENWDGAKKIFTPEILAEIESEGAELVPVYREYSKIVWSTMANDQVLFVLRKKNRN